MLQLLKCLPRLPGISRLSLHTRTMARLTQTNPLLEFIESRVELIASFKPGIENDKYQDLLDTAEKAILYQASKVSVLTCSEAKAIIEIFKTATICLDNLGSMFWRPRSSKKLHFYRMIANPKARKHTIANPNTIAHTSRRTTISRRISRKKSGMALKLHVVIAKPLRTSLQSGVVQSNFYGHQSRCMQSWRHLWSGRCSRIHCLEASFNFEMLSSTNLNYYRGSVPEIMDLCLHPEHHKYTQPLMSSETNITTSTRWPTQTLRYRHHNG